MPVPVTVLLLLVTVASIGSQLRTVRRTGTAGLSASTWLGLLTSTLLWLGYGVATAQPTLVLINVPVVLIASGLVVALVRHGVARLPMVAAFVGVPLVLWGVTWVTGVPAVLGWAGTSLVIGRLLPQLVAALRATDRSGISVGAWVGNGSNKVAWATFGFHVGDAFVAWPSLVAAVISFVIVALCRPRMPRRRLATLAQHGRNVVVATSR